MPGIKVVTDSASDLPRGTAQERAIDVIPLTIRFGDEELVDGRDLTPSQFWARLAQTSTPPETAAPSPGAFQDAFLSAARAGYQGVVSVNLSSKLSATFQAARTAAEAVSQEIPVQVVDSLSVTMGEGLVVLEASRLAREGKGLDDVVGAAEDARRRLRAFGALDSLDALRKGGRIGNATAMLGSLLSIKPIIEVRDGTVEAESKQRTRTKSLQYLVEKVRAHGAIERLAVVHGGASDIEQFLDMIAQVFPRDEIIVGDIGPVIGTHTGAGTMGVTFTVRH